MPTIQLEMNINQLHFNTTDGAAGFYNKRFRGRDGGLSGAQRH